MKRGGKVRPVSNKKAKHKASKEGQAAIRYMMGVKSLPCCICGAPPPSDAHHCIHDRYGSRKSSDYDTIPLCRSCHQDGSFAIHRGKETWRERNGPDHGYISQTADAVRRLLDGC